MHLSWRWSITLCQWKLFVKSCFKIEHILCLLDLKWRRTVCQLYPVQRSRGNVLVLHNYVQKTIWLVSLGRGICLLYLTLAHLLGEWIYFVYRMLYLKCWSVSFLLFVIKIADKVRDLFVNDFYSLLFSWWDFWFVWLFDPWWAFLFHSWVLLVSLDFISC